MNSQEIHETTSTIAGEQEEGGKKKASKGRKHQLHTHNTLRKLRATDALRAL